MLLVVPPAARRLIGPDGIVVVFHIEIQVPDLLIENRAVRIPFQIHLITYDRQLVISQDLVAVRHIAVGKNPALPMPLQHLQRLFIHLDALLVFAHMLIAVADVIVGCPVLRLKSQRFLKIPDRLLKAHGRPVHQSSVNQDVAALLLFHLQIRIVNCLLILLHRTGSFIPFQIDVRNLLVHIPVAVIPLHGLQKTLKSRVFLAQLLLAASDAVVITCCLVIFLPGRRISIQRLFILSLSPENLPLHHIMLAFGRILPDGLLQTVQRPIILIVVPV